MISSASSRVGSANSTWASTTSARTGRRAGKRFEAAAILTAAVFAALPPAARAGSYLQRDPAPADSSYGALVVETLPPGLLILVDQIEAGRSPLGPIWLPSKTVRVRALSDDPRRFDTAADEAQIAITPGGTARVFLDLRPRLMLRSEPEPARVVLRSASGVDSLLGETPIGIAPALLEGSFVRLESQEHADTTLDGRSLVRMAETSGWTAVSLRRVSRSLPPVPSRPPLYRRRWVQWALVGTGAGLTGAAAILRREADRWYDRYLESSDRRVLDTYFDRAVRYDRYSLASLGLGQVLFTGGLVLLIGGTGR